MSGITTHILDTTRGRPAAEVRVELERQASGWETVGEGLTNADGRVQSLTGEGPLQKGIYRLRFHVGDYFQTLEQSAFYPVVEIVFEVAKTEEHYHVPLLLNPFGYATYRGS